MRLSDGSVYGLDIWNDISPLYSSEQFKYGKFDILIGVIVP